MDVSRIQIEVERESINPMLKIWADLEFDYSNEIPLSISGKLCQKNGQILSVLSEYQLNTNSKYRLTLKTEQEKRLREKSVARHNVQLSALLTSKAIESIEKQRERTQNKKAEFDIVFVLKSLSISADSDNLLNNEFIGLKIESKNIDILSNKVIGSPIFHRCWELENFYFWN